MYYSHFTISVSVWQQARFTDWAGLPISVFFMWEDGLSFSAGGLRKGIPRLNPLRINIIPIITTT